jgi:hypothetical protein
MPRGPKSAYPIRLAPAQLEKLGRIARLRKAPYEEVLRAKILLLAWEHPDWSKAAIAQKLGTTPWTVWKWRKRWTEDPQVGDMPRRGAPRLFSLSPAGPDHGAGLHPSG